MNLKQALQNRQKKYPTILLAHQPQAAKLALKEFHDIDLILSGHTHGGQFFPLHIPIYMWNPFFAGLYRHKETWVYVSSGTMYWGIPLRIGSWPEITTITLVNQSAERKSRKKNNLMF
jgi:predicted MPP superfamily phosphohydrolase